jgi:oligopeptide/dipeptide ABC transporter ATP-binding protein
VVASVADTVQLMYAGRVIEKAAADEFYAGHAHPYAEGLMNSIPALIGDDERLIPISGAPPSLIKLPSGCAFHPRCPYKIERCISEIPELRGIEGYGGEVACHRAEEVRAGMTAGEVLTGG